MNRSPRRLKYDRQTRKESSGQGGGVETKGARRRWRSVNVFPIKASPAGFSESLPAHFPPSLSFSLFPRLSFSPTLSCPSRAPFRVLRSPSRSPHLIRLLAFSRMKELQRLSWDTRKYYLARLPTDRPRRLSFTHPFLLLSLSLLLSLLFPSDERRSRAEVGGEAEGGKVREPGGEEQRAARIVDPERR